MTRRSKREGDGAEQDADLFRRVVDDATPLKVQQRAPDERNRAPARARFRRRDERQALDDSLGGDVDETETGGGESLRFHRPSIGRRTMRKLARGSFAVQDETDLHGLTVAEAKEMLHGFIIASAASGRTCVRVVHGKGLGSGQRGPVLKRKVDKWLRQWEEVLAFVSARQVDGGTGALYVLLKKT